MRRILLLVLVLAGVAGGQEPPLLHPLFSDHAVLQRGRPVAVWGWARPGSRISLRLAGSPAVEAVAGDDGRWNSALPAQPAGGPWTLEASDGVRTAIADDVLFGEVWLCSGQSNMQWDVAHAREPEAEVAASAALGSIRHFTVVQVIAGRPRPTVGGTWAPCGPETVRGFSAVAHHFACHLHRALGVPIGVVTAAWGGPPGEPWVPAEALAMLPEQRAAIAVVDALAAAEAAQTTSTGLAYAELIAAWYQANDPGTAGRWHEPGCDDALWTETARPGFLDQPGGPVAAAADGLVWLRRRFIVPPGVAGRRARIDLGMGDDWHHAWLNGRLIGAGEAVWGGRGIEVPVGVLQAGDNALAIRLLDPGGRCGFAEVPRLQPEGAEAVPLAGPWRVHAGPRLADLPPLPVRANRQIRATTLWNGMVAPLAPMTLSGVVWYQGESNVARAERYRDLLAALIGGWRQAFVRPDLPFLIVQLPGFGAPPDPSGGSPWAELRESQAVVASTVPDCRLVCAIDQGESADIHPRDKREVGRRLALAALAGTSGRPVAWRGPRLAGHAIEGAAVRLRFDVADGLAVPGDGPPTGFAIAGADRRFVAATARIEGSEVVVSSPAVPAPLAVRYAWADDPPAGLRNRDGFPAEPFRTDRWPGVTAGRR